MSDDPRTTPSDPPWLTAALGELGVREYTTRFPGPHGELSNPRVEEYQRAAGQRHTDDEIAWCASFVSWCLAQAGGHHLGTGARAYARFGRALVEPVRGCIAPMWRVDPNGSKGHVNFFLEAGPCEVVLKAADGRVFNARAEAGEFVGIGGNQGDIVCPHAYDTTRVLSWRWPV